MVVGVGVAAGEHDLRTPRGLGLVDERIPEAVALAAAEASLTRARTNLAYTVNRSPIDGTVIKRSVEAGQTVAATIPAAVKLFKELGLTVVGAHSPFPIGEKNHHGICRRDR